MNGRGPATLPVTAPPTPRYDPGRARIRLTPDQLAVLGQLVAGTPVDAELGTALAQLRAARAVDALGAVAPDVADLIRTVAAPELMVDVQTTSPWGLVGHGAALRGRRVWTLEGWPGTDETEYAQLEPMLLVPAVARMVGLRRPPPRRSFGSTALPAELAAPLRAFDGALAAIDALDPADHNEAGKAIDAAFSQLAPEIDTVHRAALVTLVVHRRLAWRVTVSWPEQPPGEPTRNGTAEPVAVQRRSLAVVDADQYGLWRRAEPAEPIGTDLDPDGPLRLVRITAREAWRGLVALFPRSTRLPDQAAR